MGHHCNSVVSFCFFIISFLITVIHTEADKTVPALFIFGDSLVDVGNNNYILSVLKANFPHNGIDFTDHKATGRYTNGKNAADFIAEKLDLLTLPPYLSLVKASNKSTSFLGGVNFASGGAGILDHTKQLFASISLDEQIDYYSTVYGELVNQLGADATQKLLSKSIFGIVIGSNDMLGYIRSSSTLPRNTTLPQLIDLMISILPGQLKRIYNLGARKFAFIGMGPIGCTPSQRSLNKTGECNEEINYWSHTFNERVKALLEGMKSENNDMNYSFFDAYSQLLDFSQNPDAYGFSEVKEACCGLGNLRGKTPCLPISLYCSNRSDHVFWDFYHPTEAAYRIIVDNVFEGSQPYAYPINVKQLAAL
ncbi:hypothetical protein NE237_032604 [Protea cynaroides]|uniref:GDSL esterase/lipase n=1 Tax=Protea cynaroides TaxID=273540 RepID=A0A9Q0L3L9_9MAGN|nr:hypothetical protein NE237_032604 [Protea cynaroides]